MSAAVEAPWQAVLTHANRNKQRKAPATRPGINAAPHSTRGELKAVPGAEACRIVSESAELLSRVRHNDFERGPASVQWLFRPGSAVLQHLHVLHGYEAAARAHHLVEHRQESVDL